MIIFLFFDSLLNVDIKSLSSKTDILYGFLVFNNSIKPVDYSLLFEKSLYTLMNLFFYIRYNVITLPLSSLISYFDDWYLFKSSLNFNKFYLNTLYATRSVFIESIYDINEFTCSKSKSGSYVSISS